MSDLKEAWRYFLSGKSWKSDKENLVVKVSSTTILLRRNNKTIAWLNPKDGTLKVSFKD